MWPDLTPEVAANSLNQTVYFLRRIFEPGYKDDISADYVHVDSDLVWLDPELVSARSAKCLELVAQLEARPDPATAEALSQMYVGRFALDFEYEDWASTFREHIHARYIELIEACAQADANSGHFDRAISLLTRALDVDPEAEHLEALLVGIYRRTGAHAAASERYRHYAAVLRDQLGVDPPELSAL